MRLHCDVLYIFAIMSTIFITGGATGIGRASVKKFADEGWNVTFMDFDSDAAARALDESASDNVMFVHGDTRSAEDCRNAVKATVERFGALDSVFANAGIHQSNTILDIKDEDLHRIVDINIFGTVNALRAAIEEIKRGGGGSVVINCSDQWYVGKPNSFAYGLTKGALGQITRSLSIDLAPYNIRVNAVCAGTIDTPLMRTAIERSSLRTGISCEQLIEEEKSLFAPGRLGRPEEVAEMVYFLASPAAAFCTGGHYLVDGGLVAK